MPRPNQPQRQRREEPKEQPVRRAPDNANANRWNRPNANAGNWQRPNANVATRTQGASWNRGAPARGVRGRVQGPGSPGRPQSTGKTGGPAGVMFGARRRGVQERQKYSAAAMEAGMLNSQSHGSWQRFTPGANMWTRDANVRDAKQHTVLAAQLRRQKELDAQDAYDSEEKRIRDWAELGMRGDAMEFQKERAGVSDDFRERELGLRGDRWKLEDERYNEGKASEAENASIQRYDNLLKVFTPESVKAFRTGGGKDRSSLKRIPEQEKFDPRVDAYKTEQAQRVAKGILRKNGLELDTLPEKGQQAFYDALYGIQQSEEGARMTPEEQAMAAAQQIVPYFEGQNRREDFFGRTKPSWWWNESEDFHKRAEFVKGVPGPEETRIQEEINWAQKNLDNPVALQILTALGIEPEYPEHAPDKIEQEKLRARIRGGNMRGIRYDKPGVR